MSGMHGRAFHDIVVAAAMRRLMTKLWVNDRTIILVSIISNICPT